MSSNLMDTEKGGEQTHYEGEYTDVQPHKKSGGQLGTPVTTTDTSQTDGAAEELKERGQKTADNIRYGQAISKGGMSGFTTGQTGEAKQEGYGQVQDQGTDGSAKQQRAAGYGDKEDMNREIGA